MGKNAKIAVGVGVALVVLAVLGLGVFEVQTALFDDEVSETLSTEGEIVTAGAFHDVAHAVTGRARVVKSADGALELQLVGFRVDNGPDLEMWVVELEDAADDDSVKKAGRLVLGPLKGNVGDQSYALPADFDATKHKAAVVWCERFGVNFATAPLSPAE